MVELDVRTGLWSQVDLSQNPTGVGYKKKSKYKYKLISVFVKHCHNACAP